MQTSKFQLEGKIIIIIIIITTTINAKTEEIWETGQAQLITYKKKKQKKNKKKKKPKKKQNKKKKQGQYISHSRKQE